MANFLRAIIGLSVGALLAGCATAPSIAGAERSAAAVADEAFAAARWAYCYAPTAGALVRAFGGDAGAWAAWASSCGHPVPLR